GVLPRVEAAVGVMALGGLLDPVHVRIVGGAEGGPAPLRGVLPRIQDAIMVPVLRVENAVPVQVLARVENSVVVQILGVEEAVAIGVLGGVEAAVAGVVLVRILLAVVVAVLARLEDAVGMSVL